jgi:Rod binding domain-containing protein
VIGGVTASAHTTAGDKRVDAKLKKATADFESMLLASWLEQMKQSYGMGGEQDATPGADSMNALATQSVAQAMAARGGIGIGRMMYERLHATQANVATPVEGNDKDTNTLR